MAGVAKVIVRTYCAVSGMHDCSYHSGCAALGSRAHSLLHTLLHSLTTNNEPIPKMINVEEVEKELLSVSDLQTWSEAEGLLAEHTQNIPAAWQLPAYSCYAVGEDEKVTIPAVAAMGCLQKSIIYVDDVLDNEPDALYRTMGAGRVANFAMGLQAVSVLLLNRCPVAVERRAAAQQTLARLALQTAAGQELDVQNIQDEAAYWRLVQRKSVPYYAEGFRLGAQLGGATRSQEKLLAELGGLFGEIIQIHDDLEDAFAVPAKPDWQRRQNNLLILYGVTAESPQRTRFLELVQSVADESCLHEAQQLLVQSGALSYAVYQAAVRERQAHDLLQRAELPRPAPPLVELFTRHRTPMIRFLEDAGVEAPESLFAMA